MIKIKGISTSPGICIGKIKYFCSRTEDYSKETTSNPDYEVELLKMRTDELTIQMQENIVKYEQANRNKEAVLLEARKLLLFDIIETGNCIEMIKAKHYSARRAFTEAANTIRLQFENMSDDFMRERAFDIKYVTELLLPYLNGCKQDFPHLKEPVIIVAQELIPEGTLCFEKDLIQGMVINKSTYNSHSSILARLWSIPSLSDIEPETEWEGKTCVLDGTNGVMYIDPDKDILEKAKEQMEEYKLWKSLGM